MKDSLCKTGTALTSNGIKGPLDPNGIGEGLLVSESCILGIHNCRNSWQTGCFLSLYFEMSLAEYLRNHLRILARFAGLQVDRNKIQRRLINYKALRCFQNPGILARPLEPLVYTCDLLFFFTTRLRGANLQPVGYEFRSQCNSGNSSKKHNCQSICCDLRVKKVPLRKTCGSLAEVYATSLKRPFYINLQLRGFRSTLICLCVPICCFKKEFNKNDRNPQKASNKKDRNT